MDSFIQYLDKDEAVILHEEDVLSNDKPAYLVLSTKKIIEIQKVGFWRKTQVMTASYLLRDLKNINGKPNLILGSGSHRKELELYFQNASVTFTFPSASLATKWYKEVEKAYKAQFPDSLQKQAKDSPSLLNQLKKGILSAKDSALSFRSNSLGKTVKTKCPACGAEYTGNSGTEIKCSYCDTVFTLK